MNNSAPLQNFEDITIRPLAPVIPMKSVLTENNRLRRKVSKAKLEKRIPLFYNKPIYKSKKYDLL
jgi:hypothetical protein